jgi:hypothetical protein
MINHENERRQHALDLISRGVIDSRRLLRLIGA